MSHFGQALEFIAGLAGFFAAITGLVLWLTYLEQTLHRSPPRTAPARRYARIPASKIKTTAAAGPRHGNNHLCWEPTRAPTEQEDDAV